MMLLSLTACASTNATNPVDASVVRDYTQNVRVYNDSCSVFNIISISSKDVLTVGTARQILAHNIRFEELCHGR
jgi:hypothetical protein